MGIGIIAVLVFIGIFVIIALPLAAAAPSGSSKQALAALDAVLKTEPSQMLRQQSMSVRKDEQLSSIPWLNKKLLQFDLASRLRKLLSQAALNWNPGRLLLMTAVGFAVPPYILYMSFHSFPLALLSGVVMGGLPFGWVMFKRSRRFAAFEKGLPEALDLMVSGLRAARMPEARMRVMVGWLSARRFWNWRRQGTDSNQFTSAKRVKQQAGL